MNVKEAAKYACVSEETVRRWIRRGCLDGSMESRKKGYTISKRDLDHFLQHRKGSKWQIRSKKLEGKIGSMGFLVETDGTLILTAILHVEQKVVKEFDELLGSNSSGSFNIELTITK